MERNFEIEEYTSAHFVVHSTILNIIFKQDTSMHAIIAINEGSSTDSGLLVVASRYNRLYVTKLKDLPPNCTYNTAERTIGITVGLDGSDSSYGIISMIC